MRIFERLRVRGQREDVASYKPIETVTEDLLRKGEEQAPIVPDSKATCCSCCSVEEAVRR